MRPNTTTSEVVGLSVLGKSSTESSYKHSLKESSFRCDFSLPSKLGSSSSTMVQSRALTSWQQSQFNRMVRKKALGDLLSASEDMLYEKYKILRRNSISKNSNVSSMMKEKKRTQALELILKQLLDLEKEAYE